MRLLILGTGSMANQHAQKFSEIGDVELVGAVDVDLERVNDFCSEHGIKRSFSTLDDALDWGEFDAVANVTPDSVHFETTMKIIAAGKHVLCEKPLATDAKLAWEMTEAAGKAQVVAMVNLTFRKSPELHKARELVMAGEIGEVRHVEASYLQSWLVSKAWGDWATESRWLWRLSTAHGSNGVLGDIGIHVLDYASWGAGSDIADLSCRLKTFHKAEGDKIGPYALDANDSFAMTVSFENGAIGVIHASRFATGHLNDMFLRIHGDKGALDIKFTAEDSYLKVCLGDDIEQGVWKTIDVEPVDWNYKRFYDAVKSGVTEEPSFKRAAQIQQLLDTAIESDREGGRNLSASPA